MRREQRHGFARIWHRLVFGALDFGSAEQSVASGAVEHTIARALRCCREAVGPAQLRRLWQRDEEGRLAERQPARLLAEIGERSRPDPFEMAAIRCERDVKAQDLVFAQRLFELNRPDRLPDLGVERTLSAELEKASNLHGDARAA